jgi:hypothetical protein
MRRLVPIAGTNISTMVDRTGQFTMNGVPPGTVTLNSRAKASGRASR